MDRLDEALKTFLVWRGLAHLAFAAYCALDLYLTYLAFTATPDLSAAKAALVGAMNTVGMPMMLNWYTSVMAATHRED